MKSPTVHRPIDVTDLEAVRARRPVLVAHRGGAIGANAPENTPAAMALAAAQGFDMVELDVCQPRDGEPVLFHGLQGHLLGDCGVDAHVTELTSAQLTRLRYRASDQHLVTLAQALGVCADAGLGVMLDIKANNHSTPAFFAQIGQLLDRHGLAHSTVTITRHPCVDEHLLGRCVRCLDQEAVDRALRGDAESLDGWFWFGLPEHLPDETIACLQARGAFCLPAINVFRYPAHAHRLLAHEDVRRLAAAGADGFQIDSAYRDLFDPQPA